MAVAEAFTYTQLDTSVDCIRLVVLEPAYLHKGSFDIRCRLQHVAFAQRPKYEALSYTWGTDAPWKEIFLDNKPFFVRGNLWDALRHLRRASSERALWIDAICINQNDISERNRQVRIMPHIYNRAESVLVWLGLFPSDFLGGLEPGAWTRRHIDEICSRDYWQRVWIIQEIGKARRIKIFVNQLTTDWDRFIATIKGFPGIANSVPLKLADGLLDRYGNGHKMHTLLEQHQGAICKDQRDKIYGFVGLAIDYDARFPMDYCKNLFEVWKDTVIYQNKNRMAQTFRIMEFARLVDRLLGGPGLSLQAASRRRLNDDLALDDPGVITIPALVSGMIVHIGPTCEEMISKLEKVDEWTSSIKDYCIEGRLRNAYEENDQLLKLLELEDIELWDATNFDPFITYPFVNASMKDLGESISHHYSMYRPSRARTEAEPGTSLGNYLDMGQRLFILNYGSNDGSNSTAIMGIAPPSASVGDFICHFYSMEKAVVVRQEGNPPKTKLVGTAFLGDYCATTKGSKEARKRQRSAHISSEFLTMILSCIKAAGLQTSTSMSILCTSGCGRSTRDREINSTLMDTNLFSIEIN